MKNVLRNVSRWTATGALAFAGLVLAPVSASAATTVSANLSTVAASASSVAANGASTVTITVGVVATDGTPASVGGDTVTVATSAGTLGSVSDLNNGQYTAVLTAPATPAVTTVSATVNGTPLTATAMVTFGAGVVYDPNGGTGGPVDANAYAAGATVTVLFAPAPVKTGYYFVGWAVAGASEDFSLTDPSPATFTFPGTPVTLSAEWSLRAPTTLRFTNAAGTPLAAPATDTALLNTPYQIHLVTTATTAPLFLAVPRRVCAVNATGLVTVTAAKQCNIVVRVRGTATTLPATAVLKLTVTATPQAPLAVTSTTGVHGTPLTITTSGGSGTGAVYVAVVGRGAARCFTFDHVTVTALRPGTCSLVAMKLGSGSYVPAYSPLTTVTFS